MAKRFTSTEIWSEDWFLDMPTEYKLFWYYMLCECDHGGFFKVNVKSFCSLNSVKIIPEQALEYFNKDKERIRVVNKSVWLIEDFFVFQYGTSINLNNRLHASIERLFSKFDLKLTSIRGVLDLNDGVKEKDKDKDNKLNKQNEKNGKQFINFKAQGEELFAKRDREHRSKFNNM